MHIPAFEHIKNIATNNPTITLLQTTLDIEKSILPVLAPIIL